MALIPWDNIFYHIKQKSTDLNNSYNDYISKRDQIYLKSDHLEKLIQQLQVLTTYNNALLINATLGDTSDTDYKFFLLEHKEDKTVITESQVAVAFSSIAFTVASSGFILCLKNFGGYIKQQFFTDAIEAVDEGVDIIGTELISIAQNGAIAGLESGAIPSDTLPTLARSEELISEISENISDTLSDDTDVVAEAAVEEGLESVNSGVSTSILEGGLQLIRNIGPGLAVLSALGVDVIIGWVEGAKEKKQLDTATVSLNNALEVVDTYITKLDNSILEAQKMITDGLDNFVKLTDFMKRIMRPSFDYSYSTSDLSDSNWANWLTALKSAGGQFLVITKIKSNFLNYHDDWIVDHPGEIFGEINYNNWKSNMISRRPTAFSETEFTDLIVYIGQRSETMSLFEQKIVLK